MAAGEPGVGSPGSRRRGGPGRPREHRDDDLLQPHVRAVRARLGRQLRAARTVHATTATTAAGVPVADRRVPAVDAASGRPLPRGTAAGAATLGHTTSCPTDTAARLAGRRGLSRPAKGNGNGIG